MGGESTLRRARLGFVSAALLATTPALGEGETELITESRAHIFFAAPVAEAQALLPAGWEVAPVPAGPAQGATALLVLIERVYGADGAGKPLDEVGNRAVLLIFGRNPATGDGGPVQVGGISDAAAGAPGYYGGMVDGEVGLTRSVVVGPDSAPEIDERWTMTGPGGEAGEVRLAFRRGAVAVQPFDIKVWSGSEAGVHRIYRGEQGVAVVRSAPLGFGDPSTVSVNFSGPRLGELLGADAPLVAALHLPWYRRATYLP